MTMVGDWKRNRMVFLLSFQLQQFYCKTFILGYSAFKVLSDENVPNKNYFSIFRFRVQINFFYFLDFNFRLPALGRLE